MRRNHPLPFLLLSALLAASCGGDAANDEAAEMGAAEASDMDVASQGLAGCYVANGTVEEAAQRPSPLTQESFTLGTGEGLVCYGSPSVRDRTFIGEIEPYGAPWRTGANEPTTLHITTAATIGGVSIEPGSYSMYVVPSEGDWEVFLNTNFQRWGIPIDEAIRSTEVGSFTVTPTMLDETTEALDISWESTGDGMGNIVIRWEDWQIAFHVMASM